MDDVSDIIGLDETLRRMVRRHWITIAPIMVAFVVLGALAVAGFYWLGRYGDDLPDGSPFIAALGFAALLAFAFLLGYVSVWVYRRNRLILTDKNLYQVTQSSLFSKKVSQFSLERLQDVSANQSGVLATILGYGDVTVETAGEEENFVSRQVPDPQELAAFIMSCHREAAGIPANNN